jgi:hypothetical protein
MLTRSLVAKIVLSAFVLAALFGVYGMVSFAHGEHGGCPASPIEHTLCASPLEHLSHWQTVFTAVFVQILALFALAATFLGFVTQTLDIRRQYAWRSYTRTPLRPTMLQELFSQGILNRKEPRIA